MMSGTKTADSRAARSRGTAAKKTATIPAMPEEMRQALITKLGGVGLPEKTDWDQINLLRLVGRRISAVVVDDSDPTCEHIYGLKLDSGDVVFIQRDPEGNGPGHANVQQGDLFPGDIVLMDRDFAQVLAVASQRVTVFRLSDRTEHVMEPRKLWRWRLGEFGKQQLAVRRTMEGVQR